VKTLFIDPGSPWQNGYIKSLNGTVRYELLNGEIFDTVLEARSVTGKWRKEYNSIHPHCAFRYRPPALEEFKSLHLGNGGRESNPTRPLDDRRGQVSFGRFDPSQ